MRGRLLLLGFALLVTMTGFGLAMPVLPALVAALGGSGASYGLLVSVASLAALLAAPLWGIASDRIGRRPVLAIGLAGGSLSLLLFALAGSLPALILARAASGLLLAAVQPAALAYVADATTPEERGGGIARLTGFSALGIVVGPGLGGLLGEGSTRLPFVVGAALAALAAALILLFVAEPDAPAERQARRTEGRGQSWIGRELLGLLTLLLVASVGTSCFQAVFGMDAVRRFAMTPGWIGLLLVVSVVAAALMQGLAAGYLSRRLGDERVARLSFVGGIVGFAALGLAGSATAYLAATGLYVLAHTLLRPSLQALASRAAGGGAQGRALGLANASQGLGATLGPLGAGMLLDVAPIWPYAMGAAMLAAGLVASFRLMPRGGEA
jgi:DHA1 family multidrug resistance protein-like MFS transporter